MTRIVHAVIYIPPSLDDAFQCAREGIDHLERRAYGLDGVLRSMDDVRAALRNGASVVVFARESHCDHSPGIPVEIVGDETRRLAWSIPPSDRLTVRRQEASPSGERTAEIDTTKAVPICRRPRNDRAVQLVEDAARRFGFGASKPYRGPDHY